VEKHLDVDVHGAGMDRARAAGRIAAEARPGGVHAIRTGLAAGAIGTDAAVEAYRSLPQVERAFHTMKAPRLRVRPVHVYTEDHVKAHVFPCMLAYHVEWHMRRRLAPVLSGDDGRAGARARRCPPVGKAGVPERARVRAADRRIPDGLPVHSLATPLAGPGTLTLNEVPLPGAPDHAFPLPATPTGLQARAFRLLEIDPARILP